MRDEERYSSSRPLKEFHGNEDDYPDWETDFETWSVRRSKTSCIQRAAAKVRAGEGEPKMDFGQ